MAKIDHYASHMASVNANNKVIATESIYNQFGVLLVPEGTAIENKVLDFLVGHKMQKQLDELLSIEGCLTRATLEQAFYDLLTNYPDLQQIYTSMSFEQTLKYLCSALSIPRILLQKLTVLKIQLPAVFEQTLFSTLLGCMLAKEMKLPSAQLRNTFYVGLLHDLGLLHIEPSLVAKQSDFTHEEWHTLEQHMRISLIIAKNIYAFDDEVYRGIKEHHERFDGTGYPNELHGEKLCFSGQLISLADNICHIRTRQYSQLGKTMANIMPYIQINLHSYIFESYQAMYSIMQRARLDICDLLDQKNFMLLPKKLILQRIKINQLNQVFTDFVAQLPSNTKSKHYHALLASSEKISDTIKRAGLNNSEALDWLESIKENDFNEAHYELQELDDMHYELLWLFKKAFRIIPAFLKDELPCTSSMLTQFDEQLQTMQLNLLCAWNDYG